MTERPMPDVVFADIAADIELELMRLDLAVDEEVRRRSDDPTPEERADGTAA